MNVFSRALVFNLDLEIEMTGLYEKIEVLQVQGT